jgi:hypothetical protein
MASALAAREGVGVAAQARNRAPLRLALSAGILVESLDDEPEFVDRAAKALAILLREFRALRGCDPAEQAKPESNDADDA